MLYMKKVLSTVLSLILIMGLMACDDGNEVKVSLEDVKNIIDDYFENSDVYPNYINSFINYSDEAVVVYLKDNSKEKQDEFIHDVFSSSTGSRYIQYLKDNSLIKFEKIEEQHEIVTTIAYANWFLNGRSS